MAASCVKDSSTQNCLIGFDPLQRQPAAVGPNTSNLLLCATQEQSIFPQVSPDGHHCRLSTECADVAARVALSPLNQLLQLLGCQAAGLSLKLSCEQALAGSLVGQGDVNAFHQASPAGNRRAGWSAKVYTHVLQRANSGLKLVCRCALTGTACKQQ